MDRKTIRVWAETGDIHNNVCTDARLRQDDGVTINRDVDFEHQMAYSLRGQEGWDVGLPNISSLESLAAKLRDISPPEQDLIKISRLAIHAHGGPGEVYVNGVNNVDDPMEEQHRQACGIDQDCYRRAVKAHKNTLNTETLEKFRAAIGMIRGALADDAVVLFMGCEAAQGPDGDEFLTELSRLLPGRKVVAFRTIGVAPGGDYQNRKGAGCGEPGMRDGTPLWGSNREPAVESQRNKEYDRIWNNLDQFPWASEYSPNAIVARNGHVLTLTADVAEAKQNAAFARIPRKGQAPLPSMQDLTMDEQLVYAVLDKVRPKDVDALTSETGINHLKVQQAVNGLRRKMLAVWVVRKEEIGYIKFLDRYVG